jgi:hypothetical protein
MVVDARPVTLDDLVEVLEEQGAETRQWPGPISMYPRGHPDLGDDLPAGTYLVLKVDA